MAISLSDLTGASTSGNVLNEVNSYADFLDSVPRLVNKADPSGNTDAVQTVATKQPIALPLTKDSNGVLGGYLYQPDVTGNAPAVDIPTINANEDFVFEMEVYLVDATSFHLASGVNQNHRFGVHSNAFYFSPESAALNSPLSTGPSTLTVERSGTTATLKQDGVVKATLGANIADNIYYLTHLSHNGQFATSIGRINGYIKKATLSIEGTEVFNCDFTSPRIPHGASEFECETGQVVTVNTSGNNPSKVIKKPVLRFDGVNSSIRGWFANNLTSGYMFAAFTVNGDGGGQWGRVFSVNLDGSGTDYDGAGAAFSLRSSSTTTLRLLVQSGDVSHLGMFDDANGDILHETKLSDDLSVLTKVNDANSTSVLHAGTIDSDRFNIGSNAGGSENSSIDLEYLALFPATLTDAQADQVRSFINNRNKVFSLIDSQGYYFFDGAATYDGQVFSGSGSWNGRIVGSDNGDSNFYANENTTSENRPTTDGYKVTFADNSDKLDIPQVTLADGDSYAWMVCGTSLGTFAYKVTVSGETELNLLGHLGNATFRQAGDLYGIILLPQNATNRDIEEARRVLINRGASDGVNGTTLESFFRDRQDIINFNYIDTSNVTEMWACFLGCSNIVSYPLFDTSSVTSMGFAFQANNSLTSFPAIQAPLCSNFQNTWQSCSSLTQFPQDAKLGTEVTGSVDFTKAWRSSGLKSFSTPLPTATNCLEAWRFTPITQFNVESLPKATVVISAWRDTDLTSFNTTLPSIVNAAAAWLSVTTLVDFAESVFDDWNPDSIDSGVFNSAWGGCSSLTTQSVENILTSIVTSGKHATTNGLEGGTALTDATIDIDYNGDPLTAATLSAIETLNGRGWSVNINNEIIVPNILQLQPAAAYSLRSFDADADPTVVNVRRSSDGALSDFTASQVSDGTLTSWVNTEYNLYTSDFSAGEDGWSVGAATIVGNQDSISDGITSKDDCLKITSTADSQSNIERNNGVVAGYSYRVTGEVYTPSSNTAYDSIAIKDGFAGADEFFPSGQIVSNGSWVSFSFEYTATASGKQRINLCKEGVSIISSVAGSTGDVGYIRNLNFTQLTADGYVTTFYDQSTNGNNSTQSTASAQPLIVENGVLVTEGGEAAIDFQTEVSNLSINHSDLYGQATLDSFYVTNATGDAYIYPSLTNISTTFGMVAAISSSTQLSAGYGSPDFYGNGSQITGTTRTEIRTATSGGQKLVSHIGANTESSNWSNYNMNFGNYFNADHYSYTGKLQEMIFFNADQSVQRTGIEKNINDHFNIY